MNDDVGFRTLMSIEGMEGTQAPINYSTDIMEVLLKKMALSESNDIFFNYLAISD